MASPKHLWSGDWESESNGRTPPPVQPPQPGYAIAPEPPEPGPVPEAEPASRRPLVLGGALVSLLVIVGVVLALTLTGSKSANPVLVLTSPSANSGSSGLGQPTTPQQTAPQQTTPLATQTQPANVVAGPTYDWLGMQINATGDGVTVGSISAGSTADTAGVDPGDVIVAVNTRQITTVGQLQSAVKSISIGQRFQLIVDRGSTPVTITATLTGRPSRQ